VEQRFSTSDTALATFLVVSGFPVLTIDYSQPRFEFLFLDINGIRQLADAYITGRALTEPSAFNRVNRKLLRIIAKREQWEED